MQQIKLFTGLESEADTMESDVNAWLAESGARVVQMIGGIAPQTVNPERAKASNRQFLPSDLFLAVLYEKG